MDCIQWEIVTFFLLTSLQSFEVSSYHSNKKNSWMQVHCEFNRMSRHLLYLWFYFAGNKCLWSCWDRYPKSTSCCDSRVELKFKENALCLQASMNDFEIVEISILIATTIALSPCHSTFISWAQHSIANILKNNIRCSTCWYHRSVMKLMVESMAANMISATEHKVTTSN